MLFNQKTEGIPEVNEQSMTRSIIIDDSGSPYAMQPPETGLGLRKQPLGRGFGKAKLWASISTY